MFVHACMLLHVLYVDYMGIGGGGVLRALTTQVEGAWRGWALLARGSVSLRGARSKDVVATQDTLNRLNTTRPTQGAKHAGAG
jgi:hypothetical protein